MIYVRHDNFRFKTIEYQVYRKKSEILKNTYEKPTLMNRTQEKKNFIVGKKKDN